MRLKQGFYRRKVAELQRRLGEAGLDGLLVFKPYNLYYLFGFFFVPTERTIAAWVPAQGESALFIPKLEEEQAASCEWLTRLEVYFEHLGPPHPVDWIAGQLTRRGYARGRLGHEATLANSTLERLKRELPGATWSSEGGRAVATLRLIKDSDETALLRKAGEYADFMVECGVETVRQRGLISEIEINQAVGHAVAGRMTAELEDIVSAGALSGGLVCAGPRAALPHGLPTAARPRPGDPLVFSFGCSVGGYHAESERTFFMGEPKGELPAMYQAVFEAQAAGIGALTIGRTCAEADRAALDVLRGAGFEHLVRHRLGHGMGLESHEPPWLEEGDPTPLRPGMVVSAEPGLYLAGQGGCRISDTLVLGTAGPQSLTHYPRDLAAMVLEI